MKVSINDSNGGTHLNHPFIDGLSIINPPCWGTTKIRDPPIQAWHHRQLGDLLLGSRTPMWYIHANRIWWFAAKNLLVLTVMILRQWWFWWAQVCYGNFEVNFQLQMKQALPCFFFPDVTFQYLMWLLCRAAVTRGCDFPPPDLSFAWCW